MLRNYKKLPLYKWLPSSIDDNTVFFYFKDEEHNRLIFVEYWVDEETVAPAWQPASMKGEMMDDNTFSLTEKEREYFTKVCKYFTKVCKTEIEKKNGKGV